MSRLVGTVPFDASEAERETGGVAGRFLDVAEGDLYHEFGPNEHRLPFTMGFEREQLLGLQAQHLICQALERLAEHHELSCDGIACAKMQIRQPALPAAISPFGSQHDQIKCG